MNKYRLWLPVIILIALALRLYNLTYHSLWFDEAISVHWARQSVPRILEVGFTLVEDRLPPLYYLTLKGWTALFGFSEVGVRGLSILFGVLLIPVVASVAAALFNRRVALGTALLIGLNPFLIWYAQEARMYAPAVLFNALAVWAFLGICKSTKPRGRRVEWRRPAIFLILFIVAAIAGLYTHLYSGFLLPALGLWLIISYPRAWRLWLLFAVSGLVITLAFAPLAAATWRFSGEAPPGDPFNGIARRAWWLLHAFTIWKAPLSPTLQIVIPATVVLFAIAAYLKPKNRYQMPNIKSQQSEIRNRKSQIANPLLLVVLLLIFPFAIANLLLFRNHLAFFGARYFIVMTPWLLLLAAVGADNLSRYTQYAVRISQYAIRLLSYIPISLLLIAAALPIPGQWSIPAAKEAWRQSVAYLAEYVTPIDGILIHPDWVRFPFQFYFQGPGQTYAAFSDVTRQTPLDGPLQGVVGDHPVIWLIQSHLDRPDPNRLVEQWFASRYPLVTELYPPGIALKGYVTDYQLDALPPEATPTDIRFENGMHLIGYQTDRTATATDTLFHPPSGWVHVILYWSAAQPVTVEARPVVRLVGPDGVWGVSLERANDALELYPPRRWVSGSEGDTMVRHDMDVNLNPVTPPGRYQLLVGLRGFEAQYPLAGIEIR